MKYYVMIGRKPYYKTNEKQSALAAVSKLFNKGQ